MCKVRIIKYWRDPGGGFVRNPALQTARGAHQGVRTGGPGRAGPVL